MQSTHLREHNLSAILTSLASASTSEAAPLSRAGLAKLTRLTKPTVSKLVEELIDAELVQEDAPISGGTGRPMVPLQPAAGTLVAIGVEIAADHVSCLGIDLAGGTLALETKYLQVTSSSADEAIALAARLVQDVHTQACAAAEVELPIVGVVAAIPGRITPGDGRVLSAPNLDWSHVPFINQFDEQLTERLGAHTWPVRAQNDNRLSVLTEIDARPGESFVYVRGSTGVGGAVVLDGLLLDGVHGWAGEFGHMVVEADGAPCRCGRRGCLEAYISYYSLLERTGLGTDVRIEDLVEELSRSSDRAEVIGTIGRSLGLAVANALNVLDMSTVVLSGYLAPIAEEIGPVVQKTVDAHALAADVGPVRVERSDAVMDPALRGAARAALQPVFDAPGSWIARAG